jgi:hypothetical protein
VNQSRRSFKVGELAYNSRVVEEWGKLYGNRPALREYKRQLAQRSSVVSRCRQKTDMATNIVNLSMTVLAGQRPSGTHVIAVNS